MINFFSVGRRSSDTQEKMFEFEKKKNMSKLRIIVTCVVDIIIIIIIIIIIDRDIVLLDI